MLKKCLLENFEELFSLKSNKKKTKLFPYFKFGFFLSLVMLICKYLNSPLNIKIASFSSDV